MVQRPTAASEAVPSLLPTMAVETMPMMGSSSTLMGGSGGEGGGSGSLITRTPGQGRAEQCKGLRAETMLSRGGVAEAPRWDTAAVHGRQEARRDRLKCGNSGA